MKCGTMARVEALQRAHNLVCELYVSPQARDAAKLLRELLEVECGDAVEVARLTYALPAQEHTRRTYFEMLEFLGMSAAFAVCVLLTYVVPALLPHLTATIAALGGSLVAVRLLNVWRAR